MRAEFTLIQNLNSIGDDFPVDSSRCTSLSQVLTSFRYLFSPTHIIEMFLPVTDTRTMFGPRAYMDFKVLLK